MKSFKTILADIFSVEAEQTSFNNKLEQEKDNMFNSIVEIYPNVTVVVQDEKIIHVNSAGLSLLKCADSCEIIGKSIYEFIDPDNHVAVRKMVENEVCNDVNNPFSIRLFAASGDYIYLAANSRPFTYNNNTATLIVGSDVTERRQLDELLKKKQKNLEEAQRIGKIGSWELDLTLNKIERSDEIYRIYELDNTSALSEECLSVIHPDDRDKVRIAHTDSIKNKKPYQIEYRLLFADGRIKYISEHCETFYDELDNPLRSVGVVQDVTESRQTQAKIEMLSFALDNASEGIFVSDEKTVSFDYVNDKACKSLGYSREQLLEMTVFDICPDVTTNLLKQINVDLGSVKPSIVESRLRKKDGAIFPVEVTNVRYQFNDKAYVMTNVQDVSNRKKAEDVLQEERKLFIGGPVITFKCRFVDGWPVEYVSPNIIDWLGYTPEELTSGKVSVFGIIHPDDLLRIDQELEHYLETKTFCFEQEYRVACKDGKYIWVQDFTVLLQDPDGNITHFEGYLTDITEQKKKQNALIETKGKLSESEQRYRQIFDNSNDGLYLLEILGNSHFRLLAVNARYEREFSVTSEQCVGLTIEEIVGSETAALLNVQFQRCVDAAISIDERIELDTPMGKRTYRSILIPIRDSAGKIYRVMGVAHDVTNELKNKLELETIRNLLSDAEVIASLGNFYMDYSNDKFHCSKGVYKILELPFEEGTTGNLNVLKFVHPEDIGRVKERLHFALDTQIKFNEIFRIVDSVGIEKVVHAIGSFVMDSLGNELFLGNFQDVSAVHSLKKQVVIGEEKMKILAENSPSGILILSGGVPLFINQALLYLCGVSSMEEFVKLNPIDLVHPDDLRVVMKLSKKLFDDKNEEPSSYQQILRSKEQDGRVKIFDLRFTYCWLDNNKYLQVLVNDITDEIEREKMMSSMASDSLYISQRNSIVSNAKKELDDILQNKCGKCNHKINFRNTLDVLETYSKSDTDWGFFNKHFEDLYPGFIPNLKVLCPTLTVTDIKHCACIRLNVDTKETARFFNVTPASVHTSRVRLKKKLNLSESIDLMEFIENI